MMSRARQPRCDRCHVGGRYEDQHAVSFGLAVEVAHVAIDRTTQPTRRAVIKTTRTVVKPLSCH